MLRVFRGTFLVAIDEAELECPATLEDVRQYLNEAASIDWNAEQFGDPVGMQSMELDFESLQELPAGEVKELYHK